MSNPSSARPGGSRIGIIFAKEFREIFRDRRTVFSVVISPLLITPLLFAFLGSMANKENKAAQTDVYSIGIVNGERSPELTAKLKAEPQFRLVPMSREEADNAVRTREVKAVAVLPEDADTLLDSKKIAHVEILFDPVNDGAGGALQRLNTKFMDMGKEYLKDRLEANNLPKEFATPFQVQQKPISSGGGGSTVILAMMLPYTLAVAAFGGGIYAANDQVAGEKERGTLETLLVTPASRRDIVLGKFCAVACVCMVSSLLAVVGMMIPFFSGLKAYEWLAKGGVTLTPIAIFVILIVQLPLAVLFAGILLAISTFAKNQKEAQTYLGPLFILVIFPAMMSMFLKSETPKTMALVPVLNATLIIKQGLSNTFDPIFIALAFLASAVYAGLALTFATRLFQKESVLIKT